jgi:acetyltransferase-like isoleucine patch superfamily enzyme
MKDPERLSQMETTYRIYSDVTFGDRCSIGDFCMIGIPPPHGAGKGIPATTFGDRAEIQSHAVIYAGSTFGDDVLIGHGTYLRQGIRLGNRVKIGPMNVWEGHIIVEDDVVIGLQAGIAEHTVIGRGVLIGSQVGIAAVLHPLGCAAKESARGPHFSPGVTVGAGAAFSPGLRIGAGAYIEPGSVVMRDVRPFALVAGNPARQIGEVATDYPQLLDRIKPFVDLDPDAIAEARARFEEVVTPFPPR